MATQLLLRMHDEQAGPEQQLLREMKPSDRELAFFAWLRPLFGGLWSIKIDGRLVAVGDDEEIEDMLARFHRRIDGPGMLPRSGGMG